MAFEGYTRFEFTREGRILTATITAPGPVNAVDQALHAELARVFVDLQHDPDSDLVILTGAAETASLFRSWRPSLPLWLNS